MGYKCSHSSKDCDGCRECSSHTICDDCGSEEVELIETEIGFLCPNCFKKIIEEE